MSLRYQINLRILILSLFTLLLGSSFAIWQARSAVNEEVESSINLAVQLIQFDLSLSSPSLDVVKAWLPRFNALKATRHLTIELKESSRQSRQQNELPPRQVQMDAPPKWFINLVKGHYTPIERVITRDHAKPLTLVLQANPMDEIIEVWHESIAFFYTLLTFTFLTFVAVNVLFNRTLKAINDIVSALQLIETGNYQLSLPAFETLEYDSIAKAINHMTAELNSTQRENRALTQHSLTIQEEERQRLSQELHDELGQSLTAIKVMAVTAARMQPEVKQTTDGIISICDHLITVVRSMMRQLHPLVLSELGLKASLEDLLNHWSLRYPTLRLTLNCTDAVDVLKPTITIHLFRMVQECLTNIVRHAQSDTAHIQLTIEQPANQLHIKISDNGNGANLAEMNSGFGLLSMRERINSLGGHLSISTQPQQGMSISATIPLA